MRAARTTIVALAMAGAACQPTPIAPPNGTGPKGAEMTRSDRLAPGQNHRIQFASMRPPGSRFAALERRIQVVGPPDAAQLTETGDPALLDELVPLLSV